MPSIYILQEMIVLKISPQVSIRMNLIQIQAPPNTEIIVVGISGESITRIMKGSNWFITESNGNPLEALHWSLTFQQADLSTWLLEPNLISW